MFPKGCLNDVAVVATALSVDKEIPPEVFGMLGSSIALSISDIPFAGPTASVVVGYVDGKYIINPTPAEREKSKLHLSLAGTKDAIMMVEAGANIISEKKCLTQSCSATKKSRKSSPGSKVFRKHAEKQNRKFIFISPATKSKRLFSSGQTKDGLRPRYV